MRFNYASGISYRASGAIKGLAYGNNMTLSVAYNSRLQATQFQIAGRNPQYGPPTAASTQFSYYEDGSLRYAHDLIDERFDRGFAHDNVAMVKEAYSGSESRDFINGTSSPTATGPYRQSYQHDAFGNMTRRDNRFWSAQDTFIASYANNRRVDPGFQYDADGNLTHDTDLAYSYDAAGRNVSITSLANQRTISSLYDGDGQAIKRTVTQFGNTSFTYYVRSSVLGGRVISELNAQGQKQTGYVFAGNSVLAKQENNIVIWKHQNPITGSQGDSTTQGAYFPKAEFDPMGVDVGFEDPYINCCGGGPTGPEFPMLIGGGADDFGRCTLDGMAIECGWAMELMGTGAAAQCANNDCGPRQVTYQGQRTWAYFNAYADGYQGFVPIGARYAGNGNFSALNGGPPSLHSNSIHDTNFALLNGATGEAQLGRTPMNYSAFTVFLQSPQNSPQPEQQQPTTCDPHFFGGNDSFNVGGRAFTGDDLNVAARVVYAESSSGFSSINNGPVGNQVFDERNAIASVLYNLLSKTLSTFNSVAYTADFNPLQALIIRRKSSGARTMGHFKISVSAQPMAEEVTVMICAVRSMQSDVCSIITGPSMISIASEEVERQ